MAKQESRGLFRQQAVSHQKDRLAGNVLISQPISFSTITLFLLALIAFAAVFLWLGDYQRKEVVRGYLVPSKGLLKTYSPRIGRVAALHVQEGQTVSKGQPLVTLVTDQSLSDGVNAGEGRLIEINQQILLLRQQTEQLSALHDQQMAELEQSQALFLEEISALNEQAKALKIRSEIYSQQLADITIVYDAGHVTKNDYLYQKQQVLLARQETQELQGLIIKQRSALKRVEHQLVKVPFEHKRQLLEIDRQIAALKQQSLTEKLSSKLVLRATADGTVTAIQINEGEYLVAATPLLTILPLEAELQAELWLPTRAMGFVRLGQIARLRFDAFPHQRFGSLTSELTVISKSITQPDEANLPIQINEPVYKVVAKVDEQSLDAYGDQLPLQAGMLLEADIVLDTRNLMDWLLDPLYSLRGRL